MRITILDYGVGNIDALINMLDFFGHEADVAATAVDVRKAEKLILPGVGAFDAAITKLDARDLRGALAEAAHDRKIPLLAVCLGMHLLGRTSEEGSARGLGLINAETRRIQPGPTLRKAPHMGWAEIATPRNSTLFPGMNGLERFYFAHSYQMVCDDPSDIAATISYGAEICASVARDNILGVQFHPEKSHRFGARLLRQFAES